MHILNVTTIINSPSSHVFPVKPGAQEQVKLLIASLHVPPFLHGPLAHSSISKEFNETVHFQQKV